MTIQNAILDIWPAAKMSKEGVSMKEGVDIYLEAMAMNAQELE